MLYDTSKTNFFDCVRWSLILFNWLEILKLLLQSDTFGIQENIIFEKCVEWAEHQSNLNLTTKNNIHISNAYDHQEKKSIDFEDININGDQQNYIILILYIHVQN